jgi:predicted nucleic acid-binding protein
MPHYMLDTDTVSFALRGQGRVAARLLDHRPSQLCMSSITLAELRFGAETRRSRKLHNLISTFAEAIERLSPSITPRLIVSLPLPPHWLDAVCPSARSTPSWRLMRCRWD